MYNNYYSPIKNHHTRVKQALCISIKNNVQKIILNINKYVF